MAIGLAKALFFACVACVCAAESPVFTEDFRSGTLGSFVPSATGRYVGQPISVLPATHASRGYSMVFMEPAKHYAATAPFGAPLRIEDDRPLVVQYTFETREGLSCGGGYVKLLLDPLNPAAVDGESPYLVMFGPDRCGNTNKVHLILRARSPSGSWEEKHAIKVPSFKDDKLPHIYTLAIRANNTFTISIDGESALDGTLADGFAPPLAPPLEIDDPTDSKPSTWVDNKEMDDPTATKPDDWDESAPATIPDEDAVKPAGWLEDASMYIADPTAVRPPEWDDEEDGAWQAPEIPNPACEAAPGCGPWIRPSKANPAYRGRWTAPKVANPAYIGPWAPRRIPNPDYYEDPTPARLQGHAIGAIAVEVWTMSGGLSFGDFFVGRDEADAAARASSSWAPRYKAAEAEAAKVAERAAATATPAAAGSLDALRARVTKAVEDFVVLVRDEPQRAAGVAVAVLGALVLLLLFGCGGGAARKSGAIDVTKAEAAVLSAAAAAAAETAAAPAAVATAAGNASDSGSEGPASNRSRSSRTSRTQAAKAVVAAAVSDADEDDDEGGEVDSVPSAPPSSGGGRKLRKRPARG